MNREIKFRGFSKRLEGFCYGSLVVSGCHTIHTWPGPGHFVLDEKVIPESVGQFTGLKDRNGKEIYEGDILKINSSIQSVEYHKSGFVSMYIQKTDRVFCEWRQDLSRHYKPEVIGNIHENPELLKN